MIASIAKHIAYAIVPFEFRDRTSKIHSVPACVMVSSFRITKTKTKLYFLIDWSIRSAHKVKLRKIIIFIECLHPSLSGQKWVQKNSIRMHRMAAKVIGTCSSVGWNVETLSDCPSTVQWWFSLFVHEMRTPCSAAYRADAILSVAIEIFFFLLIR